MADNFPVKDATNTSINIRSTELAGNVHVPLHGRFYRDIPDVSAGLSAVNGALVVDVRNTTGLMLSVAANPTVAGAAIAFEGSLNSTNGTDGTWAMISAQRTDDQSLFVSTISGIGATLTYLLALQVSGISWVRVRCTAITSGNLLVTASPCDDLVMPSRAPVAQAIVGNAAHDAPINSNPVRQGTRALSAMLAPVSATNDVADAVSTLQGVTLVTLDTVSAQRLRASVAVTTTSDVQVLAAPPAGLAHHICDMQIINTGAATDLILKQGTLEIWRLPLPQNVPVMLAGLRAPLVIPAGNILNATLSVASTVRLNVQGFVAV